MGVSPHPPASAGAAHTADREDHGTRQARHKHKPTVNHRGSESLDSAEPCCPEGPRGRALTGTPPGEVDREGHGEEDDERNGEQSEGRGDDAGGASGDEERDHVTGDGHDRRPDDAWPGPAAEDCTPMTLIAGLTALAAMQTPAAPLPPPTGTMITSSPGSSSSISRASVATPAIRSGSSPEWI